ncbi:hypothetical protein BCR34DRAFT_617742 [Clohesyomyces aquaticus]|uniref:NACHT domain-containing protein n=1 Tax=Clohesyomyces aquaticus TaxID=1231657 RepID=A0A1Y1Z025_9PLEO|nr:hypothetical protein BCR34DRAFT_617742 [Clohesyomyces aquaticus]
MSIFTHHLFETIRESRGMAGVAVLPVRPSRDDLWSKAVSELSDQERGGIDFTRQEKLDVLTDLTILADKARIESRQKKWKFRRKSGETVILTDVFGKVIKWVDMFKQVGDVAVQADPVHAALPWVGVRFLLQIAINDSVNFAYLAERATAVAEIICRCAIYEDLCLRSSSPSHEELRRSLIHLYISIMRYLSRMRVHFNQRLPKRVARSIISANDFETAFDGVDKAYQYVQACSALVDIQDQLHASIEIQRKLGEMDTPLRRMSKNLDQITDSLDHERRIRILQWISKEPYKKHHLQNRKDVIQGTGFWLLSDPVFKRWKDESCLSILWLHGIPGSGKTKLISIVIEDLIQFHSEGHNSHPTYFYCSRNPAEPTRSKPERILASIARQLSVAKPGGNLLPPTIHMYDEREVDAFSDDHLSTKDSRDLIISLAANFDMSFIVIDALDECDPHTRSELLDALEAILQAAPQLVKVFVSSRDDQDLFFQLKTHPNLQISSDRNSSDIGLFVASETAKLINKNKLLRFSDQKEHLRQSIIDRLTADADGMFIWVTFQLQSLCALTTDAAHDIYSKILLFEARADLEAVMKVFKWLLAAQEQLHCLQFLIAVSNSGQVRDMLTKDQLLHLCSNLVIHDPVLDVFRFAHLSVREFLQDLPAFSTGAVNGILAETCLLTLLSANRNTSEADARIVLDDVTFDKPVRRILWKYSHRYWDKHCQQSLEPRRCGRLQRLLLQFLSASPVIISVLLGRFFGLDHFMNQETRTILSHPQYCAFFAGAAFEFPEVIFLTFTQIAEGCAFNRGHFDSAKISEIFRSKGILGLIAQFPGPLVSNKGFLYLSGIEEQFEEVRLVLLWIQFVERREKIRKDEAQDEPKFPFTDDELIKSLEIFKEQNVFDIMESYKGKLTGRLLQAISTVGNTFMAKWLPRWRDIHNMEFCESQTSSTELERIWCLFDATPKVTESDSVVYIFKAGLIRFRILQYSIRNGEEELLNRLVNQYHGFSKISPEFKLEGLISEALDLDDEKAVSVVVSGYPGPLTIPIVRKIVTNGKEDLFLNHFKGTVSALGFWGAIECFTASGLRGIMKLYERPVTIADFSIIVYQTMPPTEFAKKFELLLENYEGDKAVPLLSVSGYAPALYLQALFDGSNHCVTRQMLIECAKKNWHDDAFALLLDRCKEPIPQDGIMIFIDSLSSTTLGLKEVVERGIIIMGWCDGLVKKEACDRSSLDFREERKEWDGWEEDKWVDVPSAIRRAALQSIFGDAMMDLCWEHVLQRKWQGSSVAIPLTLVQNCPSGGELTNQARNGELGIPFLYPYKWSNYLRAQ